MPSGRQPLLRGTGQSDVTMAGFNILDVGAVGDTQQATLIVDPLTPLDADGQEIGIRGTGLPFSTLAAAVEACEIGDLIILRPGIHAFDGVVDIFHKTGITILGYGAIITSESATNEDVKITVRSPGVTIKGIEFDGVAVTPTGTGNGCIEITETGVTIEDCFFHRQTGYGIHGPMNYEDLHVLDCVFQTCDAGIFLDAETTTVVDTNGIWIKRCRFEHNRSFGVGLTGPGPDSAHFITEVDISDNKFEGNDTDASHVPVLALTFAIQGVQIRGNSFDDESSGIYLGQVKDASISDNRFKGINSNGIQLFGCIGVNVSGNQIDGRNSAGSPTTSAPILISGTYAAPNDAGPFTITGNQFLFLKTASVAISISNATGVILNSNRIEGTILFASCFSVMVSGNQFMIPQTTQAILIDASDRGSNKVSIIGNRFNFSGASISRAIATVDASATIIDDVLIEGNASPTGQTYGQGTYVHSGSNTATRVTLIGNTPESATVTTGWANAGVVPSTLYVSQAYGVDSTGFRSSRNSRFKTINSAITAASSGDTVIVQDGTFNERISAKDGVTVRFVAPAVLRCTSSGGCITSSANSQTFTVYHEHTPMICTQNTSDAVSWTHTGALLYLHSAVEQSGAGTLPTGLRCSNGTVEVWGHISSVNSLAVSLASGTPIVIVHGGLTANPTIQSTSGIALQAVAGSFTVTDGSIRGGTSAVDINMNAGFATLKRCTISASGSSPAINISTVGANVPILRDCVLVAGSSATQSIVAGSAQTVKLYGQTVANKGSDPPTNVTFTGGGTYDVSSSVTID